MSYLKPKWSCVIGVAILWLINPLYIAAQQTPSPSPAPARPGRSYDSGGAMRKPPPAAPQHQSPVTFTDITAQSGINFKHAASPTTQKYLPETMGGGVALFDYDNDGRLDIYFTNGAQLNDPMASDKPDKTDARYWNRLYHQKPNGAFEDVTERAGVRGSGYSMGVATADFDSDGYVDLYVTFYGGATLYRNKGDGTFEDVTKKAGVDPGGWATSSGWLDYDRDGRLDLFVLRYMDWDFKRGSLACGATVRAYCHPDNFKGTAPVLFHQKPDGTFENVSAKAGIADENGKGLGIAFADFDNDGLTDIFVANDSVRQFLFHNRGDGTFEDIALLAGAGYDDNGKTFAGMGVDAADYDNDGFADVFITTLSNETYPLFHNSGDLTFTARTSLTGVGVISLLNTGWGTRIVDLDNDGWRDLFVAQGHVLDTIEQSTSYLSYKQAPTFMRNNNGKGFLNVTTSAGFTTPLAARGAAFGDLDNDGDLDIVVAQTNGVPAVFRNNGTKNHWLGIVLTGVKSNRQGLGARLVITDSAGGRQIFDVTTASSYLSSNDPRVIVGLGTRTVQSIEIRWPSGVIQTIKTPAMDNYLTVKEESK